METFSIVIISVIGLLLIVLNVITWIKLRRLEKNLNDDGSNSGSIALHKTRENLKKLDKDVQELYEINSRINKITKRGICKVGVIKFNAFSEKSGNQSFAMALLDFRDSGIIFSNLQTAQGSRLFVKPIRQGDAVSGVELLNEEKKALERAKQVVF